MSPDRRRFGTPGILVCALMILASTAFLYVLIWSTGADYSVEDPRTYLGAGFNLYQGKGLGVSYYSIEEDGILFSPLTHFPPLTSSLYAAMLYFGVPAEAAPTLRNLFLWPLLLGAAALLTLQLSGSTALAGFSVLFVSLSTPIVSSYARSGSEAIFFPLLLLGASLLVRLSTASQEKRYLLVATIAVFSLLTLTRYVGVVFYGTAALCCLFWRGRRATVRSLLWQGAFWSLGLLPLAIWMARNTILTGSAASSHLSGPMAGRSLLDFPLLLLKHSSWILLPIVRPGPVWRSLGPVVAALCLGAIAAGFLIVLRSSRAGRRDGREWPLVLLLSGYLLFFGLATLLIRIRPMSERYIAAILGLTTVLLLSQFRWAPRKVAIGFLSGYAALQVSLLMALTLQHSGWPSWLSLLPPRIEDLGGKPETVWGYLEKGVPRWLVRRPARMRDLPNHHPELQAFLDAYAYQELAIISNAPDLFPYRPVALTSVDRWLEDGSCSSASTDVAVVIVDWDRWTGTDVVAPRYRTRDPTVWKGALENKCPRQSSRHFEHSTVLFLHRAATSSAASGSVASLSNRGDGLLTPEPLDAKGDYAEARP